MMNLLMKMRRSKKNGFTLIELIVVIAVLAILAAILIPSFIGFQTKAKSAQVTVDAKQIATAIDVMAAEGTTPTTTGVLGLADKEGEIQARFDLSTPNPFVLDGTRGFTLKEEIDGVVYTATRADDPEAKIVVTYDGITNGGGQTNTLAINGAGTLTSSATTTTNSTYTFYNNGSAATTGTITWAVSGITGASITGGTSGSLPGVLTLPANASGTAHITAIHSTLGAATPLDVTVNAPAAVLTINGTSPLTSSATTTTTSTYTLYNGSTQITTGITWSVSAGTTGATINATTGVLSIPANASGTATITATHSLGAPTKSVVINAPAVTYATSINVTGTTPITKPITGSTATPAYVATPVGGTSFKGSIIWSVSPTNSNVQMNASTGVLTVTSSAAAGNYTVTAKDDNGTPANTSDDTVTGSLTVVIQNPALVITGSTSISIPSYGVQFTAMLGSTNVTNSATWEVIAVSGSLTDITIDSSGSSRGDLDVDWNANPTTTFIVRATYNGSIGNSSTVSLTYTPYLDSITTSGLPVNNSASNISVTFTALDQYGIAISGVSWYTADENQSAISINQTTGVLSVTTSANDDGYFAIVARRSGNSDVYYILGVDRHGNGTISLWHY